MFYGAQPLNYPILCITFLSDEAQDENIKKKIIMSVLLKNRTSCNVTQWRPFREARRSLVRLAVDKLGSCGTLLM